MIVSIKGYYHCFTIKKALQFYAIFLMFLNKVQETKHSKIDK
tara:strand:- start:96 stop:221 length:126 start_codon:yes stop_codon:yes gene_type:complete